MWVDGREKAALFVVGKQTGWSREEEERTGWLQTSSGRVQRRLDGEKEREWGGKQEVAKRNQRSMRMLTIDNCMVKIGVVD